MTPLDEQTAAQAAANLVQNDVNFPAPPGPVAPPPPVTANDPSCTPGTVCTYSQTVNSGSGTHFGQYLFGGSDWGWWHSFPYWNEPGLNIVSAKVHIRAYDVDSNVSRGEYDGIKADGVWLNPQYLQGSNNAESTTIMNVPISTILDGANIRFWIDIDIYDYGWATRLDWSQLVIQYRIDEQNSPPFSPILEMVPSGGQAPAGTPLQVNVIGPTPADPDGDAVTYEYRWLVNTGNGGFLDDEFAGRGNTTGNILPASSIHPTDQWRVEVIAKDSKGAISNPAVAGFGIYIPNLPPVPDIGFNCSGPFLEGGQVCLTGGGTVDPDDDVSTLTFIWNFGDGTPVFTMTGVQGMPGHVYADNGTYTVSLTVRDPDGLSAGTTAQVVVENVNPVVAPIPDANLQGASLYTASGSFTDPGADSWNAIVIYGDGTAPVPLTLSGKSFQLSHAYDRNGEFIAQVIVTDDDGGSGQTPFKVTVTNIAPVVAEFAGATFDEGGTYTAAGTFTDPGSNNWTATVDYGDGGGLQPLPLNGTTFGLSHVYGDNGTFTVTVVVTDPDGLTGTNTARVVVGNVAPAVTDLVDATLDEGGTYTGSGSFADPGTDQWTATVNFGDGSGSLPLSLNGFDFDLNHTYADNGVFTATVTVKDDDGGSDQASFRVTVNNVAPVLAPIPDATIDEGGAYTGSGSFTDPGNDTWTGTVNFGDGTGNFPLVVNGKGFGLNHTYADNGRYTVSVNLKDDDGATDTGTFTVTVSNVDPKLPAIPDATLDEGSSYAFSGAFTDPGADQWTGTVDFGDGSGTQPLQLGGKNFNLGHAYADNGTFTVAVTLADDDGGRDATSFTVTVNNVSPTVDPFSGAGLLEGQSYSASGHFSDPGADSWTGIVNYGDGSGDQPLTLNGFGFDLSHTYADNGNYGVRVTVTDDDGGTGGYVAQVAVTNVEPTATLTALGSTSLYSGQTFKAQGSFTDPGINDMPWSWSFGWSDGSDGGSSGDQSPVSGSHQYFGLGTYTVTFAVTDKDGGADSRSLTVEVTRQPVDIDIKPGSDDNPINIGTNGKAKGKAAIANGSEPVAILGSASLDTRSVDVGSVLLGTTGVEVKTNGTFQSSYEDVNNDGIVDLVMHFPREAIIASGDITIDTVGLTLTAALTDGRFIIGYDVVRPIG